MQIEFEISQIYLFKVAILHNPGKLEMGNVMMNSIMQPVTLMVETAVEWKSTHKIALSVYVIRI